jgi:hypothetical protein
MDRRRATGSHESPDGVSHPLKSSHGRALHSSSNARGLAAASPSARATAIHRWTTTHSPKRSWKITTPFSLRIAQVCGRLPAQQHGPVCPSSAQRSPHPCGLDQRALSGLGGDALSQRHDVPVALPASPGANGRWSRSPASCPYRTKQLGLFIGTATDLGARMPHGVGVPVLGDTLTVAVHSTDWRFCVDARWNRESAESSSGIVHHPNGPIHRARTPA